MTTLHNADAADVIAAMPDQSIETIITDPPWPGGEAANLIGHDNAAAAFERVAKHFHRVAQTVVIVLGDNTDPALLSHVAMPFRRVCWLEFAVPGYHGRHLRAANVAYVFGAWPQSVIGRRVLPGRFIDSGPGRKRVSVHPCPLRLDHCEWLVHWYADRIVFDPFMGAGTVGAAARLQGKDFIGCELEPRYFEEAQRYINDAVPLFETVTS